MYFTATFVFHATILMTDNKGRTYKANILVELTHKS